MVARSRHGFIRVISFLSFKKYSGVVLSKSPFLRKAQSEKLYGRLFAFSKRKLCNGENFRIKDFDEFRCF